MFDSDTIPLQVARTAQDNVAALAEDARRGLTSVPKDLPPKWFYDQRGSELFEEITGRPEYYLTRAERGILTERATAIADRAQADTLVELGSGAAVKTRILLEPMVATGTSRYVPFDVCEEALVDSGATLGSRFPQLAVEGVVGDFQRDLDLVPSRGRRLVAFLGGTIGNLLPQDRSRFLASVRSMMEPGEHLLLGADLVKDRARLLAAYDDAAGVTAEFNRNVLRVLNRELDADFVPERFEHVAAWDEDNEWIEMRLRSSIDQSVTLGRLGCTVDFGSEEELRTEVSAKFRLEGLESELASAELVVAEQWTDGPGDFSLTLARAA